MKQKMKTLVWLLMTAMAVGGTTTSLAAVIQKGSWESRGWERDEAAGLMATPSNGESGAATPSEGETATPSSSAKPVPMSAATGDLWEEWIGARMDWEGDGTRTSPFRITSLAELMGLSEAVAQGEDFAGIYFELGSDIDLGELERNDGCWNPIGWFQNASGLGGEPRAFSGVFDGAGHTVFGLKFTKNDHDYSYLGLFGLVKDAEIRDLTVEAEEVSGADNVALLAGYMEGESTIRNVTVNGAVYAEGDAGGIAGEVTGGSRRAVLENCTADNVSINSEGRNAYVGGIAGNVQKADIVDARVVTFDGDSNRIQGKGYVGGIAGRQNDTNLYNVCVSGTIGGNRTRAVGGMTGLYESGDLVVARFDGDISRTNNGTASQEGTFIGTRDSSHSFRYGTGKDDNVSYLYAGSANQAKTVIGTDKKDNTWTMDAHIGYYTDYEVKYVQVAGTVSQGSGERYYYEELEDGIQYIITQKLGKDLTADSGNGERFQIDHYAPGNQGEPVRGYLVSVPRIDARNANGTYDYDVATLTAISDTNNSYYRQIDKDHPSAVAPGCTVAVATAPKNQGGNRYQMVYDENEDGKAKPPTYTDEEGNRIPMAYMSGGAYRFVMPESDTELNVEYVKVTTGLSISPKETEISVIHTRSGDRKDPDITTEVKDENGTLIARYINGKPDASVQVLPVSIHAEHNGEGSAADRSVIWSIDDTDLLDFEEGWAGGYTEKDARIAVNLNSSFIQDILKREVQAQADGGYSQAIRNTIYTDTAVVTAATNPATSVDNQAVTGTCKVTVSFQILDQTTVRVEGMTLNESNITFDITRKLTGDRKNPEETYVVTAPIYLDASLSPSQPFFKNVVWEDLEVGKIITLTPSGQNQQSCGVAVVYDENGKNNPAWLQNIINADDSAKEADGGYRKLSGSGSVTETVTATSEDQTHGVVSASCNVTIRFRTDDQTVIHPEGMELSRDRLEYDVTYTFAGDRDSEVLIASGFGERDTLNAKVLPDIEMSLDHEPYNRTVLWSSSDPDAVSVANGKLTVNENAGWIQEILKEAPYQGTKTVTITASTEDGGKTAVCDVTLNFAANMIEADRKSYAFDLILTKTGRRSAPTMTWSGGEPIQFSAEVYSTAETGLEKHWTSSDPSVLTVSEDGVVTPVMVDENGNIIAEWIDEALKNSLDSAEMDAVIWVSALDGNMTDDVPVKLAFSVADKTYSSSGSGGGGASSSGVTPGGSVETRVSGSPAGSVTGTWVQDAAGRWLFTSDSRTYADEWAYIHNPYAGEGQNSTDWFRFDRQGYMVTGWYQEPETGDWYYLHSTSDGTLGYMYTGWHWIDGRWYYFNPVSDGTRGKALTGWQWIDGDQDGVAERYYLDPAVRGAMLEDCVTPDGLWVDADGRWIENSAVQTRKSQNGTVD